MIGRRVDQGIPLGNNRSSIWRTYINGRVNPIYVTISGSYNRYLDRVRRAIEEFNSLQATVLSPTSGYEDVNRIGFSTLAGDPSTVPSVTERRHLDAISRSDLLWLIAPDGITGFATTMEIGYAYAFGISIFSSDTMNEPILNQIVNKVRNPKEALHSVIRNKRDPMQTILLNPKEALNGIRTLLDELEYLLNWEENPLGKISSERSIEITQRIQRALKALGNLAKGRMT
ncbi:MAG: hypothetical protein ACYCSA_03665 [Thermoplasmataceae archaeon]